VDLFVGHMLKAIRGSLSSCVDTSELASFRTKEVANVKEHAN